MRRRRLTDCGAAFKFEGTLGPGQEIPTSPRRGIRQPGPFQGGWGNRLPVAKMAMSDVLIRGVFPERGLRFAYCAGAELCNEGIIRHSADPLSGWLLSEALVCAALLSVNLKFQERVTLRWIYPGPIGTIMADVNAEAEVRGFPQRLTLLPETTTRAEAIGGDGRISAVTSLPNRVGRTGITEAIFRDVSRDLGYFLSLSFQVESAVVVGLAMQGDGLPEVRHANGLLIQPLPGASLERFERLRNVMESAPFAQWMRDEPRSLESIWSHLQLDETPQGLQTDLPRYICHCSKDKVESILRTLDPREIREMLEEEGMAQVNCHFCANRYTFSAADLRIILDHSFPGTA